MIAFALALHSCVPASLAEEPKLAHVNDHKASFLDVEQRREELHVASTPRVREALNATRSCLSTSPVEPPSGKIYIPRRHVNGGHGKTNPRESELSQPYYHIQALAANGANSFLITGDHKESECVLDALDRWAAADTLMNYDAAADSEAWNQVGWTIASLSLSVSVIESDAELDVGKRKDVVHWLHRACVRLISQKKIHGEQLVNENNLSYWRGLAATATGIITSDDQLFTYGLAQYERAIGQIDKDGSWPLEMERKELALHYQSFALEALVMIAELAKRQGIDLYSYSVHGRTLSSAVAFLSSAMTKPEIAAKRAGTEQKIDIDASDFFSWLEYWNRRFGPSGLEPYLNHPWFAARLAGSATLYAAPAQPKGGLE
ncbi:MAG: alginate lyase family protein [Acidobacteriaceae bacterium]|nr:alginate lyase family protein [Acidobacteriaceae bacterium]